MIDQTLHLIDTISNVIRTIATIGIAVGMIYRGWLDYREYRDKRHHEGQPTEEEK